MEWYYVDSAGIQQVVSADELSALVAGGAIRRDTLVWNETLDQWSAAGVALPSLFAALPPGLTPTERRESLAPPLQPVSPNPQGIDALSICALVFGVLSVFCFGFFGIPAVICGHLARRRYRDLPAASANRGLALAGLICGYLGLFIFVATMFFYIVYIGIAVADMQDLPASPPGVE